MGLILIASRASSCQGEAHPVDSVLCLLCSLTRPTTEESCCLQAITSNGTNCHGIHHSGQPPVCKLHIHSGQRQGFRLVVAVQGLHR